MQKKRRLPMVWRDRGGGHRIQGFAGGKDGLAAKTRHPFGTVLKRATGVGGIGSFRQHPNKMSSALQQSLQSTNSRLS